MGNIIKKTCSSQQPVSSIITVQPPSKIQSDPVQPPPEEDEKKEHIKPTPLPPRQIEPPPPENERKIEPTPTITDRGIEKKCLVCSEQNQEQEFIKTDCKIDCYYHKTCFEVHLKKQIQKDNFCLKCKCGTKMNTSFLRFCQIPNRMNLLTQLFEKQLDEIRKSTKTIRNDAETQEYIDQNRMTSELNDYFLHPEEILEYDETPQ